MARLRKMVVNDNGRLRKMVVYDKVGKMSTTTPIVWAWIIAIDVGNMGWNVFKLTATMCTRPLCNGRGLHLRGLCLRGLCSIKFRL